MIKVVNKKKCIGGKKRYSMNAFGKAEVEYPPYEWVTPPDWLLSKGYGLFVFSRLAHALEWLQVDEEFFGYKYPDLEIWECEIGDYLPWEDKFFADLEKLCDGILFESPYSNVSFPAGTVMVTKVKLTEKVLG